MKLVAMVMSVVEVNGRQAVNCAVGYEKDGQFKYFGNLNCDFEQFGYLNSLLKQVPSSILSYRNKKWTDYINKIMKELASL